MLENKLWCLMQDYFSNPLESLLNRARLTVSPFPVFPGFSFIFNRQLYESGITLIGLSARRKDISQNVPGIILYINYYIYYIRRCRLIMSIPIEISGIIIEYNASKNATQSIRPTPAFQKQPVLTSGCPVVG